MLTLAILINVFAASNSVRNIDAFLLAYPVLNLTLAYIYIGCSLLTVIACYYLWQLKKFAVYMLFVPIITAIIIDIYAGVPAQPIIAAVAQLLLIFVCLIPAWKYLR